MNNKLKALGIDFDVHFSSKRKMGNGEYMGRVNYQECLIEIDKTATEQQQQEAFLHELLHILNTELELKLEEDTIHRLSYGLHCILRDNPQFFNITIN